MTAKTQQDNKPRPPVLIFVHGLYGSNLTDRKTNRELWLSPGSVLRSVLLGGNRGVGYPDLNLPISWSGTLQDEDDVFPSSLMTQTCQKWAAALNELQETGQVDVRIFLWDWRRSFEETADKLVEWILKQQDDLSSERRALLVTYSTGSLLSWPVVSQHPELFSGWVSVGGALGPSNLMLNDHEFGWKMGRHLQLIHPYSFFTFAGGYGFYPAKEEIGPRDKGFKVIIDGEDHPASRDLRDKEFVDLCDPKEWERQGLGIYAYQKKQGKTVSPAEAQHLHNALKSAERFRNKYFVRPPDGHGLDSPMFLHHPKEKYSHLNIVCYVGNKLPTHAGWYCEEKTDGLQIRRVDLGGFQGLGDGTINFEDATPYWGGLKSRAILSPTVHIDLMNDDGLLDIVGSILGISIQNRKDEKRFPYQTIFTVAAVLLAVAATYVMIQH